MLRLAPDHLKTKKMCKNAVKKFLLVIKHVPEDRYKTKEVCEKVIIKYCGTIGFTPGCCKHQKCRIKLLIIFLIH